MTSFGPTPMGQHNPDFVRATAAGRHHPGQYDPGPYDTGRPGGPAGPDGVGGAGRRVWQWWKWALLTVVTTVLTLIEAALTFFIVAFAATTCMRDPDASTALHGLAALAAAAAIGGLVWVPFIVALPGRRTRLTVAASIVVAAPLLGALSHLDVESWRGSFCF